MIEQSRKLNKYNDESKIEVRESHQSLRKTKKIGGGVDIVIWIVFFNKYQKNRKPKYFSNETVPWNP